MCESADYTDVTELGEWLEDSGKNFSRYADPLQPETTHWVCHQCQVVLDEDPLEHECELREFWD